MLKSFEISRILKNGSLRTLEIVSNIDIDSVVAYLVRARGVGDYSVLDRKLNKEYTVVVENKEARFWESLCN